MSIRGATLGGAGKGKVAQQLDLATADGHDLDE